MRKILVTGAAGFIGFHISKKLLDNSFYVIGIDNINDYYDVNLKLDRLKVLESKENFIFSKVDISEYDKLAAIYEKHRPEIVINLAAQAGVRYSIEKPRKYLESNLVGFFNVLECCRQYPVEHLLYASSSSVYGGNTIVPFSTESNVDHPVSFYAASKKSNELMAHSYSHLYGIPTTGLRFFTVYGPWGRPDMAYYSFTDNIRKGISINVFNHGKMKRDFTYIDDIVEGIYGLISRRPSIDTDWNEVDGSISSSSAPYKIYNIGNSSPVKLMDFINTIEKNLGVDAKINFMDMQSGDVVQTYADVSDLSKDIGYNPKVNIEEGIEKFVEWYKDYYKL